MLNTNYVSGAQLAILKQRPEWLKKKHLVSQKAFERACSDYGFLDFDDNFADFTRVLRDFPQAIFVVIQFHVEFYEETPRKEFNKMRDAAEFCRLRPSIDPLLCFESFSVD